MALKLIKNKQIQGLSGMRRDVLVETRIEACDGVQILRIIADTESRKVIITGWMCSCVYRDVLVEEIESSHTIIYEAETNKMTNLCEIFNSYFDVVTDNDPGVLDEALRLRYQV